VLNGHSHLALQDLVRAPQQALCGTTARQSMWRQHCAFWALEHLITSLTIFQLGSGFGPCFSLNTRARRITPNGPLTARRCDFNSPTNSVPGLLIPGGDHRVSEP